MTGGCEYSARSGNPSNRPHDEKQREEDPIAQDRTDENQEEGLMTHNNP
jgi:hypothetical protein